MTEILIGDIWEGCRQNFLNWTESLKFKVSKINKETVSGIVIENTFSDPSALPGENYAVSKSISNSNNWRLVSRKNNKEKIMSSKVKVGDIWEGQSKKGWDPECRVQIERITAKTASVRFLSSGDVSSIPLDFSGLNTWRLVKRHGQRTICETCH